MTKKLSIKTKWRRVLKWIREEFPANYPLLIQRKPRASNKKEDCGYCEFRTKPNKHYYIFIDRRQVFDLQIDTLIHEVAHALTWHGNDDDHHGPEWGLAYAKIYRAFLEWNYGRPHETDADN